MQIRADGHTFEVTSTPGAAPTVVFETGIGAESREWDLVVRGLEGGHATFFYDRLNRGSSDRAEGPRTNGDMATDLVSVLASAGVAGPVVMVGHSFGAHVALAYAGMAADVVGVVLVDPTNPRQFDAIGPLLPDGAMKQFWTAGWRRSDSTPEHIDFPASFAITAQVDLADTPLVVLVAGGTMAPGGLDAQDLWLNLARDFLAFSRRSSLEVVADSGHFIQRDQPQAVAAAITRLLADV